MSQARTVTATFTIVPVHQLSLNVGGSGSGAVSFTPEGGGADCQQNCIRSYSAGTRVRLTASASAGSRFEGWSGPCRGKKSCKLTMSAAQTVTASFNTIPVHPIDLAIEGSGGTVFFTPEGSQASCRSNCTNSYSEGTRLSLRAQADAGATFISWTGDCKGKRSTCSVSMKQARSVTAIFSAPSPPNRVAGAQ
jgi:hypothetical protein